ncbi:hypothetical protein MIND_00146400 [Mycena indigotica]|uniref:Uncharacterized protein n=1 Tax=Mycena indigotica TaxID=2126181 RepID=A0A8H6WFZ4_9AGAR|nr:uncharacterized protein MIND_00146400 [Mycena indigotica]KAF7316277.1 hypothetical protein MIND_00146400 [Mycena indigotica]
MPLNPSYNHKLTLEYMREHQPFDELPTEYYPCSQQMQGYPLPNFVYGFAFRRQTNEAQPTLDKLDEMQSKIPDPELRDKTKWLSIGAILQYIANSVDADVFRDSPHYNDLGISRVDYDRTNSIFQIFRVYSSKRARTPKKPLWVDDIARIAAEIYKELGWEDVPKPQWYLDTSTIVCEDDTDFNIVPRFL